MPYGSDDAEDAMIFGHSVKLDVTLINTALAEKEWAAKAAICVPKEPEAVAAGFLAALTHHLQGQTVSYTLKDMYEETYGDKPSWYGGPGTAEWAAKAKSSNAQMKKYLEMKKAKAEYAKKQAEKLSKQVFAATATKAAQKAWNDLSVEEQVAKVLDATSTPKPGLLKWPKGGDDGVF